MIHAVMQGLESRWLEALSEDVQVVFGPTPTAQVVAKRIVTIGDFTGTASESYMGPGQPTDLSGDIACTVEVLVPGVNDQELAVQAADELYEQATAALRAPDESLGVPGLIWARAVGQVQLRNLTDKKTLTVGRGAAIPFIVRFSAGV